MVDEAMIEDVLKEAEVKMQKSLDALHKELSTIRTGRATPALLERVHVDYYGTSTPLQQLAQVHAPEPRLLVIQPYDRSSIAAVSYTHLRAHETRHELVCRL